MSPSTYDTFVLFPLVTLLQHKVERRYKHFDWLHERLTNKYSCIVIPPLPDKTFMAKHGEDFVEKRRMKLQQWINRSVIHA